MSYQTQHHTEKYDPNHQVEFELSFRTGNTEPSGPVQDPFAHLEPFINDVDGFVPRYYPERVIQDKERDLMREKGICLGEYVNDIGAKNREFRITGKLITPELQDFQEVVDSGRRMNLICMQWEGEVLVEDSEVEGPVGVDVETKHWMYNYQLNLVSTGNDEQHQGDHGIITRGDD